MQTNGRLVEDIEHVDQLRANLSSQTDALTLTTRQRGRLAVEGQIVETHIEQEVKTGTNLLQYLGGYLLLLGIEMFLYMIEPFAQLADIHSAEFGDVLIPDAIGQRLTVQSLSVTLRTLAFCQKLIGPFLTAGTLVALHDITQIFDDAIEPDEVIARCVNQFLVDTNLFQ